MRLGVMWWWCVVAAAGVMGRARDPNTRHTRQTHMPSPEAPPQDMPPEAPPQDMPPKAPPQDMLPEAPLQVMPPEAPPQDIPPETTPQDMPLGTPPQNIPPKMSMQDMPPETVPQDMPPGTFAQDTPAQQKGTSEETIHAEELLEKYGYLDCVPPGSEGNTRLHRLLLYRRHHSNNLLHHPLDFRLETNDLPPHREERVPGQSSTPQEDLNMPSVRQNLLSPIWSVRGSKYQQKDEGPSVAVWDPDTARLHHLPVCTLTQIQQAVAKFQTLYHVGAHGDLDFATVGLLSSPRCGNPDTLMEEEPEPLTQEQNSLTGDLNSDNTPVQVAKYLSRPRRSVTRRLTQNSDPDIISSRNPVDSTVSTHKASSKDENTANDSDEDLEEALPDQKRLREVAQELREATRSQHPPVEDHVEWEPHPEEALRRRRRWVEELMENINSGEEDARLASLNPHLAVPPTPAHPRHHHSHPRDKRSIYSHLGHPFNEGLITWRLVTSGYSSQLEVGAQRASLALAFRMWSEVIPPVFLEDKTSPSENVNINIGFGKRSHLGCVTEFDGLGGELGHTLRPDHEAQIHMDDDEHFTLDSDHGTNLVKVAVHEIGHVLGLEHVVRNYSIMYPVYEKVLPNQGLELGWEDRKLVQRVYGACIGAFNTLFDFLRWHPDGSLTYNTYFFRKDHFWMYENKYNRTRFGDPLYIQPEWQGLPNNLDGYAHVWTRTKDTHLFFQGANYYLYDPQLKRVAAGYPRRIAQDFHGPPTPKRPMGRTIPSDIDSVYFDKRDENLYFFKGKKVYGYDVSKGSTGCCLPGYPKRIKDEFTPADEDSRSLPRDLDAVYYSYTDKTLYFLKDRLFWELVTFHPHDRLRHNNNVVGPFFVHHKWYDICDTELDPYYAYTLV